MSVELEYLRMIPGSESIQVGLVISINGHSGRFSIEGKLLPMDEPEPEPAPEPVQTAAKPTTVDYDERPKRKYAMKARKSKAKAFELIDSPQPKPTSDGSQWGVSWANAIVEALRGGNLTGAELMEHACRIRSTKIPVEKDELAKLRGSFSVSLDKAKKAGQVKRIVENGIDKWSVA